jgi:hypothetical protein
VSRESVTFERAQDDQQNTANSLTSRYWLPPQLVPYAAMAAEADDGDVGDVPTEPTPAGTSP